VKDIDFGVDFVAGNSNQYFSIKMHVVDPIEYKGLALLWLGPRKIPYNSSIRMAHA